MKLRLHLFLAFILLRWLAASAQAEPQTLPLHRVRGGLYVAVGQLAQAFELGRERNPGDRCAEYRTATEELAIEVDRRDIRINGVVHWLNAPVIEERGALWIRADDVYKTIIPVMRPPAAIGKTAIRTVFLDPGHGGSDNGARGLSGHVEKEWTLDIVKRAVKRLEGHGFRVACTRESDHTVPLKERSVLCAAQRGDLFVSVHFNSGSNPLAEGIETFCLVSAGAASTSSGVNQPAANEHAVAGNRFDDQSVWLAHCVHLSAVHATGAVDRGVKRANFEVLREAVCPAILIEGGFLTNQSDEQKILTPEYRERLANAIADGILAYQRMSVTP